MAVTAHRRDDFAAQLSAEAPRLSRAVLEVRVALEYRAGRIGKPDVRRLLGFESRFELEDFLRSKGIDTSITRDELARQLRMLDSHTQ